MGLLPRFVILAVAIGCVSCKTLPLPSYITACYRNDPKLEECATKSGQAALPTLVKGDRKYRIPSMDPLEIDELIIGKGNGSVSIDLKINNMNIFGFGNTQIKATKFDFEKKIITLSLFIPFIQVTGDYIVNGKVLLLPISGKGLANITLDNTVCTYLLKYKLIKKADGLEYISPSEYNLSGRPTGAHIHVDNLFNGNKALTDNMNAVLNDNWEVLIDEMGPPLLEGVGLVLFQVVTNALHDIPYDVVFPVKT